MSSGGPKLKSSHPCRNSAVDGLPSTTRAAAQTWSTTRETRIGDTRDRFEALSDTPRVPQLRRSSSGPGADRHDHSERSTRTAGAATRARVMMDIKRERRAGNPIATRSLCDRPSAAPFLLHQDRHIAPRRVEMARIQRPRSPRNRARLSRSRAARRRSPAGAARARRPPGRPADRAAERGRQSRALPIGSASQCAGAARDLYASVNLHRTGPMSTRVRRVGRPPGIHQPRHTPA